MAQTHESGSPTDLCAIVLAAGMGKRMGGDLPKVLHEAAGRPLIHWVLDACRAAGVGRLVVVVGYRGELVREALAGWDDVSFVEQREQLGTGHAAAMAAPIFHDHPPTDVIVLAGDAPLIRPSTLASIVEAHRRKQATVTLASAILDDPSGYGRVIRDANGAFDRIVEQKDASPEERVCCEINPSYYCFRSDVLFDLLERVSNRNAQGEYYLTDVPGLAKSAGLPIALVDAVAAEEVLGVNTPEQLETVSRILRDRHRAGGDQSLSATEPSS